MIGISLTAGANLRAAGDVIRPRQRADQAPATPGAPGKADAGPPARTRYHLRASRGGKMTTLHCRTC